MGFLYSYFPLKYTFFFFLIAVGEMLMTYFINYEAFYNSLRTGNMAHFC